jgi:hypothetical protein
MGNYYSWVIRKLTIMTKAEFFKLLSMDKWYVGAFLAESAKVKGGGDSGEFAREAHNT